MNALPNLPEPLSPSGANVEFAVKLAALSHPTRVEILTRIAGTGGCSCKDVVACLNLAQSTVSQHLKVLVDAGLLRYAADRQRSRYELNAVSLAALCQEFRAFADACCATRAKGS